MTRRDTLVAAIVALLVTTGLSLRASDRIDLLSIDVLFWLRDAIFGARHDAASSPTVVIAIDEETFRQPPFKDLSTAMWTPQIAQVVDAVIGGGASAVGFDIILSTSVERFLSGYDRPFRVALHDAASRGKVVLSKIQHRYKPLSPFPGYSYAVGHQANIRSANLLEDEDGVIRRVPLVIRAEDLTAGERFETSLSLELAARAVGSRPELSADGKIRLGDYEIPGSAMDGMVVNFDGGTPIPTYSLADLFACAGQGRQAYFSENFKGRVVLLGAVLDVEDRKLTSRRLMNLPEGSGLAARCVNPVPADFYNADAVRDSLPGVYVHAQALNDLLRHDALRRLGRPWAALLTLGIACSLGLMILWLGPGAAGAGLGIMAAAWTGVAILVFQVGVALPLFDPILAGVASYVALVGYRFVVVDRHARQLRQAFSLYLPARVINRMVAAGQRPELGGELREVTVWFSDMEGFTGVAEVLAPAELVRRLNAYLAEVTEVVESHGGIIDKYTGDGVLAVFGAPVDDADHARNAVAAALACRKRLAGSDSFIQPVDGRPIATRFGICTGEMVVGNIGSRRRFNYTVMGDAVNLASRLETANKIYGGAILASESTVAACGDSFAFREVDRARLPGRHSVERIFEPMGASSALTEREIDLIRRFGAALAEYRERRFAEAAAGFGSLADGDPTAGYFVRVCAEFAQHPPPDDWNAVTRIKHK